MNYVLDPKESKGINSIFLSNISDEIRSILGNYIQKYRDKSLDLRLEKAICQIMQPHFPIQNSNNFS